jgi:hypothetical protein
MCFTWMVTVLEVTKLSAFFPFGHNCAQTTLYYDLTSTFSPATTSSWNNSYQPLDMTSISLQLRPPAGNCRQIHAIYRHPTERVLFIVSLPSTILANIVTPSQLHHHHSPSRGLSTSPGTRLDLYRSRTASTQICCTPPKHLIKQFVDHLFEDPDQSKLYHST